MEKIRRVVAMLTVIVIVAFIIATVVLGIMGSRYFFGMLFLAFVIPVVLWVFMWFTKLLHGESDVIPKENKKENEASEK